MPQVPQEPEVFQRTKYAIIFGKPLVLGYKDHDGKVETVRLRFFYRMMNTVIDKFGSDVVVYKVDDEHFEIDVPVAVSPQFFGWIFGLGGQVQIMSPKPVVRKMKEMLKKVGDKYKA